MTMILTRQMRDVPRDTPFHTKPGGGLHAVADLLENLGILARYALGLDYVGRDGLPDADAVRSDRCATLVLDRP